MKKRLIRTVVGLVTAAMLFSSTGCALGMMALLDDETEAATEAKKEETGKDQAGTSENTKPTEDAPAQTQEAVNPTNPSSSIDSLGTTVVREQLNNTAAAKSATVLVYMNGSDLESECGEASTDISEMIAATQSSDVNVVIQTMGTKKWQSTHGISSNQTERFQVTDTGLVRVDSGLGQLDCTASATLLDFINWGAGTYPADRYILILWDHGGGPVYGFGYDEWNSDEYASLTIDEMRVAISSSGVKFDFVGMDCCIMSCIETCLALYGSCDYAVLSEEFESGLGWSYTGWLSALAKNPAINTVDLAKIIIDDMVSANVADKQNGDSTAIGCIDLSMVKVLWTTWVEFAYQNEEALLGKNYSVRHKSYGKALKNKNVSASLEEYYITDMMAVAQSANSEGYKPLESALANALVYYKETDDETALTGIAVTLPYADHDTYEELAVILKHCGVDDGYITWLEKFTSAQGFADYYDYTLFDDSWSGWNDYKDDYDWNDWGCCDEDEYWLEDNWCCTDDEIESYYGSDWYDDYYDSYYDPNYWFGDEGWYEDDEYGYYDPDDDTWYDNYEDIPGYDEDWADYYWYGDGEDSWDGIDWDEDWDEDWY